MLIYTLLLFPLSLAPVYDRHVGAVYGLARVILSALFVICAVRVLCDKTH